MVPKIRKGLNARHRAKLTLKIYTKGERLLRIEVVVQNTQEAPVRTFVGEVTPDCGAQVRDQ